MKTIKKSIALLLALVMVLAIAPISAFAEDDALNYLEYRIENDEVIITGYKNDPVDLVIPAEIEGKPVTRIGSSAFYNCKSLQSVTIPDSVTIIHGSYEANGSFEGCTSLENVTLGSSLKKIQDAAFANCIKIKNIVIPDSVVELGHNTFYSGDGRGVFSGCTSLENVVLGSSLSIIGESVFRNCSALKIINIPESLKSINYKAFHGCSSLREVHITNLYAWFDLDFVWDYNTEMNPLFSGAKLYLNNELVENLVIPNGITEIKPNTFIGCSSIKSITIPDSVTNIGADAFRNCNQLESISIGVGLKSIDEDAFYGCSSLSSITVADENPVYDSRDNCNAIIETATDTLIVGCANIAIPNSVSYINNAFNGFNNITSVTFPNNILGISNSFNNCSIKNVVIPKGVLYFGSSFEDSLSLTDIFIPNSIVYMYANFSGCNNLENITIEDGVLGVVRIELRGTNYYLNEANWDNDILYVDNILIEAKENSSGKYTVREGTKIIVTGAFNACMNLTDLSIPDSVVEIGEQYLINKPLYNNPDNWESGVLYIDNHLIATDHTLSGGYVIKEGIKSIASIGMVYNELLESLIIPNSILSIPFCSIVANASLKNIIIPESIKYIGFAAFSDLYALETIEIPETVKYILPYAFSNCPALTDAYIYNGDCELMQFDGMFSFDKTVTIHSYAGGKVEEFANRYGYNFVALPPKPHTHTFGEWTVVTPATYTAAGEKTRACTGCEETEIEVIPMLVAENVATNDNTGITVKYDDSVYGEDIQLDISEVTEGAAFELVNGDNGNGHHKSKLFDINTTVNGVKVQPNGKVLVGIPVPRGFNEKKVVIYYVTDDGSRLEKLDSYVENGIIWFETDHFSYYAVVDESEIVEEKSPWELFLDILRNLFRLILKLFSFSL